MNKKLTVNLQPKQLEFLKTVETTPVTLYGGAKGGGKSFGLRNIMLIRRFQYANSTGAIFRKTYPELEANHIRPLFQQYPDLRQFWHEGKKLLSLPNGSTLQFCHASNEGDIDLYQGREYHDLGIEEVGQWTEIMFRKLQGSNRSSIAGIKARTLLTANPGGAGHKWLKRLFIEKRFNERERAQDYAFIQALVDDNASLIDNDPDYVFRLESEPNEALRMAYRYGSWDVYAGQFFSEINRDIHFIKPFPIPPHWNRFGAYDYGYNHPAAFAWFAVDSDGTVFQYRELVQAGIYIDKFAEKLLSFPDTSDLNYISAGWDCWAKKNTLQTGATPTIAEEFQKYGIFLSRAKIDRIQGASHVRNYLQVRNGKPRYYIFNSCPITFDCLTRMEHDPNRAEDVLKVDATEGDPLTGDDSFDCIRYGLMSRPPVSDPEKIHHKFGTPEHAEEMAKKMEQHMEKKLKRESENKGGEFTWQVDQNMTPSWNNWTD